MQKSMKCCVSVTTMDDQVIRQPREHCHGTDLIKSSVRNVRSNMKGSVQSQSAVATRQIVARALADIPDEILTAMPINLTLTQVTPT